MTFAVIAISLMNIHSSAGQFDHIWAEDQPSQSYTVYNGKVYMHQKEKESGFFSNLFNFDSFNFVSNPVVKTVLGWTDSWFATGPPLFNDTLPEDLTGPNAGVGSQNSPQFKLPFPGSNQMGEIKNNGLPPYDDPLKQPGDLGNQQNPMGLPMNPYGQPPYQPRPQYPGPYGQPNSYKQPPKPLISVYKGPPTGNSEIAQSMDLLSNNIDAIVSSASSSNNQDRNFQTPQRPKYAVKPHQPMERNGPPKPLPSRVNKEAIADNAKENIQNGIGQDGNPCPVMGQWKWDGEACIAIGAVPSWACRPNDFIVAGRGVMCKHKIFSSFEVRQP